MNEFTIKDLENLSGIKAHTIRIWEQRYHFLKPQRTATNIRYYSNDELKTVLNIALLNKCGFKISHINRMEPEEIKEKILSIGDTEAIQERTIHELIREMTDLEMEKFERIITHHISARGIENTILQVIFPFLDKIGILWQTGHINPAQEHLVCNIIRQKLIAAIETAMPQTTIDKTILLFLPEGEQHELGLLFMHYLLKTRGATIIYLGANVPFKDVEQVVSLKRPHLIFIHLTSTTSDFNFEKLLCNIEQRFCNILTVISGHVTRSFHKKLPACIAFKRSLPEMMDLLASLSTSK